MSRIEHLYHPYHRALDQLLSATRARFGCYLLIDCHSMPSAISPGERGIRRGHSDIVLGDCHGTACDGVVIDTAHRLLSAKGYAVTRNAPYAGGFTTCHYGRPAGGGHGLQIEINRSLYMDERSFDRKPFLGRLMRDMRDLIAALAAIDRSVLLPA
jgi:N-formylglutamate amidohydrolase